MSKVAYTVICTIRDKDQAADWLRWLREGHITAVCAGGASRAEIVCLDDETGSDDHQTYEIRYIFDSRGIFESYVKNHAPALRAEGLSRFPPGDGFTYKRTIGDVLD